MTPCTPEAYNLMHEGAITMSEISSNGFRIDTDYLQRTKKDLEQKIIQCRREIKEHEYWKLWLRRYGQKANLASPDQLRQLLYKELKYPIITYTDTGKASVDVMALEKIDDPFCASYTRMKQFEKALQTYLSGIERETKEGFLRNFFNLHTTVTWRSSSDSVNFQNIPIRNDVIAELIRKCFIPRKGRRLVELDCAGVEVRISACYHKDPMMIKYIMDPTTDMHRDMACELFLCQQENVTKGLRTASKNSFVFPEFYGSYYPQVGADLWDVMRIRDLKLKFGELEVPIREHLRDKGITEQGLRHEPDPGTYIHHVKTVEKRFWGVRFKVYAEWKNETYSKYLKEGGWRTKTGFYVEGIYKKNDVTNHPIQGSAFHCLLWALIRLQKWLRKHKMKTKIVGQIHDSVVLDAVVSELQDVLHKWRQLMSEELPKAWRWIIVPIEIEAEVAGVDESWYHKKPWHLVNNTWVGV